MPTRSMLSSKSCCLEALSTRSAISSMLHPVTERLLLIGPKRWKKVEGILVLPVCRLQSM